MFVVVVSHVGRSYKKAVNTARTLEQQNRESFMKTACINAGNPEVAPREARTPDLEVNSLTL